MTHEGILLEISDTLGEETGSDEEEDAGGDDEEGVESESGPSSVDEPTDAETSEETADDGEGSSLSRLGDGDLGRKENEGENCSASRESDGGRRGGKERKERSGSESLAHTSDKDNSLESLSHDCDERKQEESPLPSSTLVLVVALESDGVLLESRRLLLPLEEGEGRDFGVDIGLMEGSLEFDSPLRSRSIHLAEEGGEESQVSSEKMEGWDPTRREKGSRLTGRRYP